MMWTFTQRIQHPYKISNEELKRITNTTDIKVFCKTQHLKHIAHAMRSNNDIIQKQFLFNTSARNRLIKLDSDYK